MQSPQVVGRHGLAIDGVTLTGFSDIGPVLLNSRFTAGAAAFF
jgi:hypothetical protein